MTVYRWRGVRRDGSPQVGQFTTDSALLAAVVEDRFNQGWRFLAVCSGEGPTPPSPLEGPVALIDRHPGTGKRMWWAESAAEDTATCEKRRVPDAPA